MVSWPTRSYGKKSIEAGRKTGYPDRYPDATPHMADGTAANCLTRVRDRNGATVFMSQVFSDLVNVVARLRSPGGCPWDLKQTHDSLKSFLLEEAYEVLDALDHDNPRHLREELGDLLLQILLHARIESEQNAFDIDDVIAELMRKIVRRHPHVFAADAQDAPMLTADRVVDQWDTIKRAERAAQHGSDSILAGIPAALPALLQAYQMQTRASRAGFDWNTPAQVMDKLNEELEELRTEIVRPPPTSGAKPAVQPRETAAAIEHEVGDVLFTIANVARFLHINPEEALRKANRRFLARFQYMERHVAREGGAMQALTNVEWDALWEAAKRRERTADSHTPLPPNDQDHE